MEKTLYLLLLLAVFSVYTGECSRGDCSIDSFVVVHAESEKMFHKDNNNNFSELTQAWDTFFKVSHWGKLIEGCEPIESGCGLIYELPNYLQRQNEDLAIADMRHIEFSEPHYHIETEVYFVLQGGGIIVVGGQEQVIASGDAIVIPSSIAHFVIPNNECVIAVVNTPPFNRDNYKVVTETNADVCFDRGQFLALQTK